MDFREYSCCIMCLIYIRLRSIKETLDTQEPLTIKTQWRYKMDNVTDADFATKVLEASNNKPVLSDFWATWCAPCRAVAPILEDIASQYSEKISIVKLDTDENPKTSIAYNITSIPTLLLFFDGQVVKTIIGAKSKQALLKELEPWLN